MLESLFIYSRNNSAGSLLAALAFSLIVLANSPRIVMLSSNNKIPPMRKALILGF